MSLSRQNTSDSRASAAGGGEAAAAALGWQGPPNVASETTKAHKGAVKPGDLIFDANFESGNLG
eukprot:gene13065-32249_t